MQRLQLELLQIPVKLFGMMKPWMNRIDADVLPEAYQAGSPLKPMESLLDGTLKINEIFYSVQGESTWAGVPCVFVRLTACDLRCTYCDTEYAFFEGKKRALRDIVAEVQSHECPLVEITGGEPLLQKRVHGLMTYLCDQDFEVLIETSGAHDISVVDPRVHRIMDLKCPSSGECARNRYDNLSLLGGRDEVKFVIGSREDYDWARSQVVLGKDSWVRRVRAILFSPVHGSWSLNEFADSLLRDRLPRTRMQLQMHKYIWSPTTRGV